MCETSVRHVEMSEGWCPVSPASVATGEHGSGGSGLHGRIQKMGTVHIALLQLVIQHASGVAR